MDKNEPWRDWAVQLQSIAQVGLFYGKDPFDLERYEQIRMCFDAYHAGKWKTLID